MSVRATPEEISAPMAGDGLVPDAQVVMDRAFTLDATPEQVWPWLNQLGKKRAGWYFPSVIERFIPQRRRGLRRIDPALQDLQVGAVIPDWGGKDASFEIIEHVEGQRIVHWSQRGNVRFSWAIVLSGTHATRVHLRLRIAGMKRPWLARTFGDAFDAATVVGLAAGLRERTSSR